MHLLCISTDQQRHSVELVVLRLEHARCQRPFSEDTLFCFSTSHVTPLWLTQSPGSALARAGLLLCSCPRQQGAVSIFADSVSFWATPTGCTALLQSLPAALKCSCPYNSFIYRDSTCWHFGHFHVPGTVLPFSESNIERVLRCCWSPQQIYHGLYFQSYFSVHE
jgi:hypothetical protein